MQQAICPARPQPIPRPAVPDMEEALRRVRAQAPTTPAPADAQHDPCPNCKLPHKPGNPCRPAAGNGGSDGDGDAGNGNGGGNGHTPAQLLDLLTAVREALDIPHAATTGHDKTRTEILTRRISHTVIALGNVLDGTRPNIPRDTAYLRDRLAEHPPVGYVTTAQARAALDEGKTWADAVTHGAAARYGRDGTAS